jgi:hypothetical protein
MRAGANRGARIWVLFRSPLVLTPDLTEYYGSDPYTYIMPSVFGSQIDSAGQ